MAQIISNEIPSGVIDSSNVIYTLANEAAQIISLMVDGAEYFNFSLSGDTITLADAPTLSIYVDYVIGTPEVGITGSNTLSEVYEKVYDLMGEKTTSTTYPIEGTVDLINEYIDDICKGEIISLLDGKSYRAGDLSFLEKKVYYKNISPYPTSVETAENDPTITVNTTGYPSSGYAMINGEIVSYTGKTATQLTGVSGITTDHEVGSLVNIVYELPAVITKPFQVYDSKTGEEIEYQDFRYNDKSRYYTILTQDAKDYIYFNKCGYNNMLVKYYKSPNELEYGTDDQTEILLPGRYGVKVVAPLVAGDLKYSKGEEVDLAMNNLNKGYKALNQMYNYYSQKAKIYRKGINVTFPGDPTLYGKNIYNDKRDYINV